MLSGVGLLLIFMIQNTDRVRLDFVFWAFTWPLWLLTMASALLGGVGLGVMQRDNDPAVLLTYLAVGVDRVEPIDPWVDRGQVGTGASILGRCPGLPL